MAEASRIVCATTPPSSPAHAFPRNLAVGMDAMQAILNADDALGDPSVYLSLSLL